MQLDALHPQLLHPLQLLQPIFAVYMHRAKRDDARIVHGQTAVIDGPLLRRLRGNVQKDPFVHLPLLHLPQGIRHCPIRIAGDLRGLGQLLHCPLGQRVGKCMNMKIDDHDASFLSGCLFPLHFKNPERTCQSSLTSNFLQATT